MSASAMPDPANRLALRMPDDFHLHLRDGEILRWVLPASAAHFGRALVMPNLDPPVATGADAVAYRKRIMRHVPKDSRFRPLMTLYLTERTAPSRLRDWWNEGIFAAVKLYPAGATTNSESGVRDLDKVRGAFECMEEAGIPLCIHGEANDSEIDIFDREARFIETTLECIRRWTPGLRIVLEHVTTADAVAFVRASRPTVAATITVHHLIINRNRILAGGIRPHYYCLPVAKRECHRRALVEAATAAESCFFLGTDSAPHPDRSKLSECGCAGIYTAPVAMACLAHVFEDAGKLANLERFASRNGPEFYGLEPNPGRIRLEKRDEPLGLPKHVATGDERITVFDPGFPLHWRVAGADWQ